MKCIGKYPNGKLTNKPQLISYDDLRYMYEENLREAEECRAVTESSMRGKSHYGDVRTDKGVDFRLSFFRDVLLQDPKTSGFVMGYPGGRAVIRQGERGSYYRGERRFNRKDAGFSIEENYGIQLVTRPAFLPDT